MRWCRSTCARASGDDADHARAQAQAHPDPGGSRLRPGRCGQARPSTAPELQARSGPTCWPTPSTRSATSGHITITTRADGDCAEIDIADDGPGIPAKIRDRVFDPFFTTKGRRQRDRPGAGHGPPDPGRPPPRQPDAGVATPAGRCSAPGCRSTRPGTLDVVLRIQARAGRRSAPVAVRPSARVKLRSLVAAISGLGRSRPSTRRRSTWRCRRSGETSAARASPPSSGSPTPTC